MTNLWRTGLTSLALLLAAACAHAQLDSTALRSAATRARDLSFPERVSSFGLFSAPSMALYKPEGTGPFPAIVLQHQCGGLGSARWQNMSMLEWAKTAVKHGYVALLIDSLGPRGVDTVCMGPKGDVNFMRGARDALQAATYLAKWDFVDSQRIAHAGYSWGAMVGLGLSGKQWSEALGDGNRFAAAVSFYPGCFTLTPRGGLPYELLNRDTDRPLLVLMGGQDTETPSAECITKLQTVKEQGAPVQWHLYPEATHCWDCKNLHNFSKVDFRGSAVTYRYDEATTQDAERRMFEFLDNALRAQQPN
jgi:dienelactone hydrolase